MKNLAINVIQEIEDALREGNKIQAIKIYKEATGEGLLEAKQAIDGWNLSAIDEAELWRDKHYAPAENQISETEIVQKIGDYLAKGKKLEAIKWIKNLKEMGLKEAKDYVEDVEIKMKTTDFEEFNHEKAKINANVSSFSEKQKPLNSEMSLFLKFVIALALTLFLYLLYLSFA